MLSLPAPGRSDRGVYRVEAHAPQDCRAGGLIGLGRATCFARCLVTQRSQQELPLVR